jgi:hypothetical protein
MIGGRRMEEIAAGIGQFVGTGIDGPRAVVWAISAADCRRWLGK